MNSKYLFFTLDVKPSTTCVFYCIFQLSIERRVSETNIGSALNSAVFLLLSRLLQLLSAISPKFVTPEFPIVSGGIEPVTLTVQSQHVTPVPSRHWPVVRGGWLVASRGCSEVASALAYPSGTKSVSVKRFNDRTENTLLHPERASQSCVYRIPDHLIFSQRHLFF